MPYEKITEVVAHHTQHIPDESKRPPIPALGKKVRLFFWIRSAQSSKISDKKNQMQQYMQITPYSLDFKIISLCHQYLEEGTVYIC